MPQMGPLMWLGLLSLFLIVFMFFFGFIYFAWLPKESSTHFSGVFSEKVWKW